MMKRYLLTIYQPDGPPPADLDLGTLMTEVNALVEETKSTGAWVFNGGLHPPESATVLRPSAGEVLVVDGPYLEGKEHVGGVIVIDAADLDAALGWGRRFAGVIGLPIEVRPFQEEG
jgi:hypothetical protein